jgi:hypothetical protein
LTFSAASLGFISIRRFRKDIQTSGVYRPGESERGSEQSRYPGMLRVESPSVNRLTIDKFRTRFAHISILRYLNREVPIIWNYGQLQAISMMA